MTKLTAAKFANLKALMGDAILLYCDWDKVTKGRRELPSISTLMSNELLKLDHSEEWDEFFTKREMEEQLRYGEDEERFQYDEKLRKYFIRHIACYYKLV